MRAVTIRPIGNKNFVTEFIRLLLSENTSSESHSCIIGTFINEICDGKSSPMSPAAFFQKLNHQLLANYFQEFSIRFDCHIEMDSCGVCGSEKYRKHYTEATTVLNIDPKHHIKENIEILDHMDTLKSQGEYFLNSKICDMLDCPEEDCKGKRFSTIHRKCFIPPACIIMKPKRDRYDVLELDEGQEIVMDLNNDEEIWKYCPFATVKEIEGKTIFYLKGKNDTWFKFDSNSQPNIVTYTESLNSDIIIFKGECVPKFPRKPKFQELLDLFQNN